ncbi:FAD-binding protein [Streptomyces sp. NPDC002067]
MTSPLTNWAGNVTFGMRRFHAPTSVAELRQIVARSDAVRALGTGHSFNTLADTTGDLVSTARLPQTIDIDPAARTVTVSGGTRFGTLASALHDAGYALHNLGSLPHISIAGACATGTHGSGDTNGNLSSAVRALRYVDAAGEWVTLDRGSAEFAGSVVALGALGIVTHLTLDVVPAFDVQQWVYEGLPTETLRARFPEVMSAGYSVSVFTRWRGESLEQVWLKRKVDDDGPAPGPARWHGATRADAQRHPVPGMAADACSLQLGISGPSHRRLPHFRLDATPSSRGDELQSEYFVAREDAVAAFDALHAVRRHFVPCLRISEIRTVAADDLWLSPAHNRDSVAFHFTWLPDRSAVTAALRHIENALAPFAARPHWGKLFTLGPDALRALYPHYGTFEQLLRARDPEGVFRNNLLGQLFAPGGGREGV